MKIGTKIASAGVATLALASGLLVTGVGAANATTTGNGGTTIGWQPDANDLGNLSFYDAAGHQITSGSTTASPMAAYYVSDANATNFGANPTSGSMAFTTPVNGTNSAAWAGTQGVGSPNAFPVAALPGDLAGFAGAVVKGAATDGSFNDVQILSFPNNDTATGYANLYEVRMNVNGVTNKWYAADILVNTAAGTWTQVFPNQTAPSVTLAAPATATAATTGGTAPVTLTATLGSALPGTVQFLEGASALGAPVAVSGTTASTTINAAVGSHSYTAQFIPQPGSTGLGSTSAASSTNVLNPATATSITVFSQSVGTYANDPATIVFSVTPSAAVGTVAVSDGPTALGNATATATPGQYSLTTTALGAGAHTLSGSFTPTDATQYAASGPASGTAFSYVASPTVGPAQNANVTASVTPGIVTITTPYTTGTPFDLGPLALDSAASFLVGSATFPAAADAPITITDTRAGDLPWTATVTASDLTSAAGDKINGQNFGFAPSAATYPAGNALTGKVVVTSTAPANGAAVADPGTLGLKGGPVFAQVLAPNSGVGTAYIRGLLSMKAPTSTKAGVYNGQLTFTVIGS
jgi:hypothetical protein